MMPFSEISLTLVKEHNSQNLPYHVHTCQWANDHTKPIEVIDSIKMATIDCVIDTWNNNLIHTFHLTFSILSFLDFRFVEIISPCLTSRKII